MKAKHAKKPPPEGDSEGGGSSIRSDDVPPEHARFESLTRRLLAVPKAEVDALLRERKQTAP